MNISPGQFTVAIPTYRRFDTLKTCLEHIGRLNCFDQARVLVIDNSLQRDESLAMRKWAKEHAPFADYIITPKAGVSYARNIALLYCDTEYIAYLDDDAFVDSDWLENIIEAFSFNDHVGVVGGKVTPMWEIERPNWLAGSLLHQLAVIDYGDVTREITTSEWIVSANTAYSKKLLMEVGGWDETLGRHRDLLLCHEELDCNTKIRNLGYSVVYTSKAHVRHVIQKERISQVWLCKDAFWERISRSVFEGHVDIHSFDEKTICQLSAACQERMQNWKQCSTASDVELALVPIRDGALELFRSLNLKSGRARGNVFVHVVTPCFNDCVHLSETIQSVLTQSGNFHLRYHVQDGASQDSTLEILEKVRAQVAEGCYEHERCKGIAFTYESEPDSGMYDAINHSFSNMVLSPASVMGWINADDVLQDGALSVAAKALSREKNRWIIGQQYVRDESGDTYWYSSHVFPVEVVKSGCCDGRAWLTVQQEGSFWRKDLWDQVGGLDLSFRLAGDWDLWRRFAHYAVPVQVPFPLGAFRLRPGQLSEGGGYLKEINSVVPQKERERKIRDLLSSPEPLDYYQYSMPSNGTVERRALSEIEQVPHCARDVFELYFRGSTAKNDPQFFVQQALPPVLPRLPKLAFKVVARKGYNRLPKCGRAAVKKMWYSLLYPVLSRLKETVEVVQLKRSRLFLERYYLDNNPEVGKSGMSAVVHYVRHGSKEGRRPNPYFDDHWYRIRYPEVSSYKRSLLFHYVKHGWKCGYDPSSEFNGISYLEENEAVRISGMCPLKHYLLHGLVEEKSVD